jgi:hypothetical protein
MKKRLTIATRVTVFVLVVLFFVLFGKVINARPPLTLESSSQEFTIEMAKEMLLD